MYEVLVSQGLCRALKDCATILPAVLETDSQVFVQLFSVGEHNKAAFSAAIAHTLSHGTSITGGVPIRVEAFRESHEAYRSSGVVFKSVKPFAVIDVHK